MDDHGMKLEGADERPRIGRGGRIAAVAVVLVLAGGFLVLLASEKGWVNLRMVFGVCGFKQRYSLPCPGCGWTHAAQSFVSGRIGEAFVTQPAAVIFCMAAGAAVLFALHIAVFGIDLAFLRWARSSAGLKTMVIVSVIVFFAGWLVTLVRAILEKNGF